MEDTYVTGSAASVLILTFDFQFRAQQILLAAVYQPSPLLVQLSYFLFRRSFIALNEALVVCLQKFEIG